MTTHDARRAALAALYVEKIGYDPFDDDGELGVDDVEELLRVHAMFAGWEFPAGLLLA